MLERRRLNVVLGYMNWLSLVAVMVVFGIIALSRSMVVGLLVFLFAALFASAMFNRKSVWLPSTGRPGTWKPLGNPLLDIMMTVFCVIALWENMMRSLFITGIVACMVDLVYWLAFYRSKGRVSGPDD